MPFNSKLPVGTGLALRNDVFCGIVSCNDVTCNLKAAICESCCDNADSAFGKVRVIGKKRNIAGNVHPGKIHDHGSRPAKKPHLSA